ncbi:hypothetical protein HK099_001531 [Clydaea vesicula]|uniref:Threonine dehydratase n=1 Tax=Clydaea vesicula TaxID=447962 RepID=A0AAD5TVK9_9FUNG|nr:hypothetical protein HK099_001531 [Clydaea vesicula]
MKGPLCKENSEHQFFFPKSIIPKPEFDLEDFRDDDGEEIDYLKLILTAKVYDVAVETPLVYAPKLSQKLGNTIYLKREDLQPVFSFKIRGAYNKISQLSQEEKLRGVICCSAGNHAQGVALAAQKLGINATIVMPKFAPEIKVESVKRFGGNIILVGNDFDEAKAECLRLQKEKNLVFISPFDDKFVIAGQGTIGVEILKQLRQDRLDAIFICCGGGGMISGIAAYIKRIKPETRIIGVNTFDSDSLYQSLKQGKVVNIPTAGLFSDGTSVRQIGYENFKILKHSVDDMVLVTTDEICAAIKDVFDETRTVMEPSGALAAAGMKKFLNNNQNMKGGVFVAITSGANMNFERLRFVAERARLGEEKEVILSVELPEKLGTFLNLYNTIQLQPRSVTEFTYRYSNPTRALFFIAVEVKSTEDKNDLEQSIKKMEDVVILNISNNELAKNHGRYLVGGRSAVKNERLIRFSFPERPGKLSDFLNNLENHWNITLWHYRNNGSDFAKVLAGIQVPELENNKFNEFLEKLG